MGSKWSRYHHGMDYSKEKAYCIGSQSNLMATDPFLQGLVTGHCDYHDNYFFIGRYPSHFVRAQQGGDTVRAVSHPIPALMP